MTINGNDWAQSGTPLNADRVLTDAKKRVDELQKMVDTGEAAKPELEKLRRVLAAFEDK